jgi:hypothetical protein
VRAGLADEVDTDYTSLFGGEAERLSADALVQRWRGLLTMDGEGVAGIVRRTLYPDGDRSLVEEAGQRA